MRVHVAQNAGHTRLIAMANRRPSMNISKRRLIALAPKSRSRVIGFTLIELLITVAIIGILGMVAYPSFMDQIRKGRRSDAMDLASQVMQAQERYRGNSPTYSTAPTTHLGFSSTTSKGGYYTMAITAPGGDVSKLNSGYVLTLTAVSGKSQASDTGCTSMTVTVSNGSPTYDQPKCWSR